MLLQRQPTPFTVSWQKWKFGRLKTAKKIQLTFCSAARIAAGRRALSVLLRGLPRVKDLICKSAALRGEFQRAPHPACFGPQCRCRCSSTAATIFFCYRQSHARGCSRDTKLISVVPVRMRDAAAEQSHLFPWYLSRAVSPRMLPVPSSGVGQGLIGGFCLARWCAPAVFPYPF